ncbi:LysR family transcriptional regulator [Achromobacter sp. NPDC058515]|uniref:LysR family transcriptional regulator n=1 Tax=Achromobacter sp. NPDC058515 TaxID=3346533 RepID=UPI0036550515
MTISSRISTHLKFRHIRFMLTLAETRSMARTALRLSISYPAVVKTRQEIEDVIGARLLDGRGDDTTLTEVGASLVRACARISAELDCAGEEITALRDGLKGHVLVGLRVRDALRWFAPVAVAFRKRYPGISLSLVDGLHQDIAEGRVDLGLARIGPARKADELEFAPLFPIRSVIVGSGIFAAASSGGMPWPEMVSGSWCLPPLNTPLRDRFDDFLNNRNLPKPKDVIEVSDITAQVEILRAGPFFGITSQDIGRELQRTKIARIVANVPELDDDIALIWRAKARLHPAVFQLKQFILEQIDAPRAGPR